MNGLFRFKSIHARIVVWNGLSILVMMAALIVVSVITVMNTARESAKKEVGAQAGLYATRVKAQIEVPLDMSRSLAQSLTATQSDSTVQPLTRAQVNAMLRELLVRNPSYFGTWTVWEPNAFDGKDEEFKNSEGHDATGRFIPYWVRGDDGNIHMEPLLDYDTMAYYQCPRTTGKECVIDPFTYPVQGKEILMTSVVVPVMMNGAVVGAVGIDMELQTFQQWANEFEAFDNRANVRLLAHNGLLVADKSNAEATMKSIKSGQQEEEVNRLLPRIQNGENIEDNEADHLSFYAPIQMGYTERPWSVSIDVPNEVIYEHANQLMIEQGLIGLGLIVAGMVILWLLSKQISNPIRRLTYMAEAVSAGSLEMQATITSEDEVGALARAFNEMVSRIRMMLDKERSQREHLQDTVQEYVKVLNNVAQGNLAQQVTIHQNGGGADDPMLMLGNNLNTMIDALRAMIIQTRAAATGLSTSASEILASTTQQASGASEQSAAISQTTTTVDEVRAIAEQAAQRAQQVKDSAQETANAAQFGQKAIQDTIQGMSQLRERVEGIAENILLLSEQTQQIGEIIATVNEIAAKSNMLALNASVEAARAGEHGKGFSVVAAEVRSLAEQSREATAQVKSILSEIQKATNATVMATEEGNKGVERTVQLTLQTQKTLEELAAVIANSSQAAVQVAAGSRQQLTGVDQIATAMQNINMVTTQSLASTRQAENAAQDLSNLALQLVETVNRYQV